MKNLSLDRMNKFVSSVLRGLLKHLFIYGIIFFAATFTITLIFINKSSLNIPKENHDAIIVLGAGLVRGDRISETLASRLNKALEYANSNKDSIIIVSGGQGADETISEAFAMKKYLLMKSIDENRIFMEDKSVNTKENFLFSKKILDGIFDGQEYSVVFVTNDFHILRSGFYARKAGLDAEGLACGSLNYLLPKFYIREYFALAWYYVFEMLW